MTDGLSLLDRWRQRDQLYELRKTRLSEAEADAVVAYRQSEAEDELDGEERDQALKVLASWIPPDPYRRER